MDIYLVQHAQAKSTSKTQRVLFLKREWQTLRERSAYAEKLGFAIDRIYHSGKLRAKQTAEILARHLGVADKVETKKGLDPSDSVAPIRDWLGRLSSEGIRNILIVGHLPFLDKLTSLLVAGTEDAHVVAFQNAGIVKLVPKSAGSGYSIQWIITPDIQ